MIVQITRGGTVVSGCAEDLERLREEFDRRHCILLPHFLAPSLLESIHRDLERAEFYERTHSRIGVELCLKPGKTLHSLGFQSNDPRLFETIERITGCGRIGCFDGRVYRMVPGSGHYDSWHSDLSQGRMVAMSINLSTDLYRGGVTQIRDESSKQILHEVANTGFGDAILFRISPDLMHRITEVEGSVPKTAYAGWFRSEPDYQSLLRERMLAGVILTAV